MNRMTAFASLVFLFTGAGFARSETTEFLFASVGQSYSAFLAPGDPRVGQIVTEARIFLDVEAFNGSDAADFFTDISFPIDPLPGNTSALVLTGGDLGWSGSGTFHHFEATMRFNGTFISGRYGAETPNDGFSGRILEGSRIEFDFVPEPASALSLMAGAALLRKRV